jgi:uncharacterized ParB-like nuclease family protein
MVASRPLAGALQDFQRARHQAVMEALVGRLRGRSLELLSFHEVADMLKVRGRSVRGVQEIPLAAIVGSVGRYNDFSRSFLPRNDADAQRWAGVRAAGHVADLPPIDVYQIGGAYFVLDGNHRVSIARQLGLDYIHANVTEVHTRVSLSPDVSPDELIIHAEYAAFLDYTRLDDLRPGCDLRVTVPGQYARLENHIEVHRFFAEMAEEREIPDREAATSWYDEAYLPLVQAIREQAVLRDFPKRTETDLYLWLAEHQAQLRNELGWPVRPDTAVSQFADHLKPRHPLAQAYHKVVDAVIPAGWKERAPSAMAWSQERLLDRYSASLFAEVLLPIAGQPEAALAQALAVAQRENGRLIGLLVDDAAETQTRAWFEEVCAAAGVAAVCVKENGSLPAVVGRRVALADLLVVDRTVIRDAAVWLNRSRPVLLLSGQASPMRGMLLACMAVRESALFAAAYLAEQWHIPLVVSGPQRLLPLVQAYLEMHEVDAKLVAQGPLLETAGQYGCDLVIVGQRGRETGILLGQFSLPILLCP